MSESALLVESLQLMGIGMGIVFSFLVLLVGMLRLMSSLALRLAPLESSPAQTPPSSVPADESDDLIAVIASAVARYRRRH